MAATDVQLNLPQPGPGLAEPGGSLAGQAQAAVTASGSGASVIPDKPADNWAVQANTGGQAGTYAPTLNSFDENKGVAGRVGSIIKEDSPLMQLAQTRGTQAAAKRGLLSSSLAGEAEMNSVLGAATPIAQADATLFQQQQLTNQGASNQASQFNAGQQQNQNQFAATQVNNVGMFNSDVAQKGWLATVDANTRTSIADLQAASQNNDAMRSSWSQMMQNIQAIQVNPDLTPSAKQSMINSTLEAQKAFTTFWSKQVLGGGGDVSDILNFGIAQDAGGAPPPDPNAPTPSPAIPPFWESPGGA